MTKKTLSAPSRARWAEERREGKDHPHWGRGASGRVGRNDSGVAKEEEGGKAFAHEGWESAPDLKNICCDDGRRGKDGEGKDLGGGRGFLFHN